MGCSGMARSHPPLPDRQLLEAAEEDSEERLWLLASDSRFLAGMARHPHGRANALSLTEVALAAASDRFAIGPICGVGLARGDLLRSATSLPEGAVAVLARLGQWEVVLGSIAEAPSADLQTARVMQAVPHAGPERLRELRRIANTIKDENLRGEALLAVASALADAGSQDLAVLEAAREAAAAIEDPLARSRALAAVAVAVMAGHPNERALIAEAREAVDTIGDPQAK